MAYQEILFDKSRVREMYAQALENLKKNIVPICLPSGETYAALTTGPGYPGIWQEHNHDSLLYADYDLRTAQKSHEIFYSLQTSNGLMPAWVRYDPETRAARPGYAQIQIVYPLAASAWEIFKRSHDRAFLQRSYTACAHYDDWLVQYRDTMGTGLVEMFCEYDTGHDNSPRVTDGGIPHWCADRDAAKCPESDVLPIAAADLSACRYRALRALGCMARELGIDADWDRKADRLKDRIYAVCYDPIDDFFYDVDRHGKFRKYRAEHIFRLFLCGVLDQADFDRIYDRHIANPAAFASPYPFPSVALDDPHCSLERTENNWGGMAQAHTALETIFWMRQYGREDDFRGIASIWLKKWLDSGIFTQELHPITGEISPCAPNFTTSLIAFVKFAEILGYIV